MKIKNNKALTIVETLISILLLAIMLAGGVAFYFNSSKITALAMQKKMAMEMANQAMEEKRVKVKVDGFNSLSTTSGWELDTDVGGTFGDFSAKIEKRITEIGSPPYKQVEVQACWQPEDCSVEQSKKIILATYIAP